MSSIVPGVATAIEEIRCTFDRCVVEAEPDGSGGTIVVVRDIPMDFPYVQAQVWIGFQITFQYPYADVYPHFTNADLARSDGGGLGGGFGAAKFQGQPAIQVSRRSNRLNPETDTAALKLLKVIRWMKRSR